MPTTGTHTHKHTHAHKLTLEFQIFQTPTLCIKRGLFSFCRGSNYKKACDLTTFVKLDITLSEHPVFSPATNYGWC